MTRATWLADPDEKRVSCVVTPVGPGYSWVFITGDGLQPRAYKRGASAWTLTQALEEAAKWARFYESESE